MRISDGTETMEVSVKEYGDHSDKEITDRALPPLVDWAETPGTVRNVRRTSHRLMELFANDGADARTILGHIPYGMKLGLSIRLHAPDIQDDERGLPDDIGLTRYMRVSKPSPCISCSTAIPGAASAMESSTNGLALYCRPYGRHTVLNPRRSPAVGTNGTGLRTGCEHWVRMGWLTCWLTRGFSLSS